MKGNGNGYDEKDLEILRLLIEDSSRPQKNISSDVGISAGKVTERKKSLMEHGIIKKYTVEIDYAKLGYSTEGFFHVKITDKSPDQMSSVLEYLMEHDNVVEIHELFGQADDYLVKILCKTNADLRAVGDSINSIENVDSEKSFTYPVARTLKRKRGVPI